MANTWKGQARGGLSGHLFFAFLLRRVGIGFAYFFLKIVAVYFWLFSPSAFKSIHYYLHRRLHFGRWSSIFKIYRNYVVFGQTLLDRFVVMTGIKNKLTFDFDGEEYIREMAKNGKGGFLISAHLGNWEIAGHLLKRIPCRFNIVMMNAEHENIKEYLEDAYKERPVNFIFIKDDLSHIFAINNAIRNGEIVCIHSDRFLPGSKTFEAEFLGESAPFPAGPFEMAYKLRVPYCFVFAVKESDYHYHFFSNAPKENAVSARRIFEEYIEELQKKVFLYPLQWFNYYDFWMKPEQRAGK